MGNSLVVAVRMQERNSLRYLSKANFPIALTQWLQGTSEGALCAYVIRL